MLVRNNKVLKVNHKWLKPEQGFDPYNPLGLPPYTIRVLVPGYVSSWDYSRRDEWGWYRATPAEILQRPQPKPWYESATVSLVERVEWDHYVPEDGSSEWSAWSAALYQGSYPIPVSVYSVYDIHYESSDWYNLLSAQTPSLGNDDNKYIYKVLGANTTGVTNFSWMLRNLEYYITYPNSSWNPNYGNWPTQTQTRGLKYTSLFDTTRATTLEGIYHYDELLTNLPLYIAPNLQNCIQMCYTCRSIDPLDIDNMFIYLSEVVRVPLHSSAFSFCQSNITIPNDWK